MSAVAILKLQEGQQGQPHFLLLTPLLRQAELPAL
jgi:hypothetical protein